MKSAAAAIAFALLLPAAGRARQQTARVLTPSHASHRVPKAKTNSSSATRSRSTAKSKARPSAKSRRRSSSRTRSRHAEGIAPARASQIEQALESAGYLTRVSGEWDGSAAAAMKKYQADHHWQTRFVPDARALIALGLGPAGDQVPKFAAPADVGGG